MAFSFLQPAQPNLSLISWSQNTVKELISTKSLPGWGRSRPWLWQPPLPRSDPLPGSGSRSCLRIRRIRDQEEQTGKTSIEQRDSITYRTWFEWSITENINRNINNKAQCPWRTNEIRKRRGENWRAQLMFCYVFGIPHSHRAIWHLQLKNKNCVGNIVAQSHSGPALYYTLDNKDFCTYPYSNKV